MRILAVDDDEIALELLRDTLVEGTVFVAVADDVPVAGQRHCLGQVGIMDHIDSPAA